MLEDIKISKAIIESYKDKLLNSLELDAAIVGAGPSGLVCAFYLAEAGFKVGVFERKLSIGGGMWGGGMMFNSVVIQPEAKEILDNIGIGTKAYGDNYFLADAVESVCGLGYKVTQAGAKVFNLISVEDVAVKDEQVCGLVLNWSAVEIANLHVDPLTIKSRFVLDATGHATEIAKLVERKSGLSLETPTGKIEGEKSMWAEKAESMILDNTKEICPGLYVCGMAANATFGAPRMGPIFGGMLMSGKKAAEMIIEKLKKDKG